MLATRGEAAVMTPILKPLLRTLEKESSLMTRPSVSRDRKDLGAS
jgi:hypothetical protein